MWCDIFYRCHKAGIFFDQIFYASNIDSFILHGKEHRFGTSFLRLHIQSLIQIDIQRCSHFIPKINHNLRSTFPMNLNAVVFRINIIQIQPDTLGYTDSCAKQKRQNRHVTFFRFVVINLLAFR